jgi:two-component system, OmpR family, catabolic regulation response regulator CreB
MARVLLLEDDPAIAKTVVYALERESLAVIHCLLLQDARRVLQTQDIDLLILDVGLPDGNGLDLCRDLRMHPSPKNQLPVLVLSARTEETDKVLGLELGADDYVGKPFSPRELVARVRALLRRGGQMAGQRAGAPVQSAQKILTVDSVGQRIELCGHVLPLTRREFHLLACLLKSPGRIYSRDSLLDAAWGSDTDSADRTVDTHIKTLRAKLRLAYPSAELIATHRGMGYSIELPAASA